MRSPAHPLRPSAAVLSDMSAELPPREVERVLAVDKYPHEERPRMYKSCACSILLERRAAAVLHPDLAPLPASVEGWIDRVFEAVPGGTR